MVRSKEAQATLIVIFNILLSGLMGTNKSMIFVVVLYAHESTIQLHVIDIKKT